MDIKSPKIYKIKPSFALLIKLFAWIFLILALSMFGLPYIPEENPIAFKFALFPFFLLGSISLYCFYIIKKFPKSSIALDEDGLWYDHLDKKEGLIIWKIVEEIRESQIGQRLIVFGRGKVLIKIEYQLSNFAEIRKIILDNLTTDKKLQETSEYSRKSTYHIFVLLIIVAFSSLGLLAMQENQIYGILAPILVIPLIFIYLIDPFGLSIRNDELVIKYPLKSRIIKIKDIIDIKLTDEINKNQQYSVVQLIVKDATKPIKFKNSGAGIDSLTLYRRLKQLQIKT